MNLRNVTFREEKDAFQLDMKRLLLKKKLLLVLSYESYLLYQKLSFLFSNEFLTIISKNIDT